jgi:hypothetical protein
LRFGGTSPNPRARGDIPVGLPLGDVLKVVLGRVPSQEAFIPHHLAPDYRQHRPDVFEH